MTARILVINPNSNESVTRGMDRALRSRCADEGPDVTFRTMVEGPFGIESDDDIEAVIPLVVAEIEGSDDFDAFVIACYSDPGLTESRAISAKPVFGIHESAVSLAVAHGRRFGVLALSRESIQRHIAYVRQLGYQSFHAGERPLDISVDEAANDPRVLQIIIDTGRELVTEDGAEILILGCAGMAEHSRAAQREIGVPVIDPVSAAVTLAAESLQA
jgi:Asp/Glu/hydantoin racemase